MSDPCKTSIPETSANKQLAKVKQEECDDDIVLVGTSNSRSHRQLSGSVPLAVGSTYAGRKASYGKGNNSKERSDTHESSNVVPRDSYQEEEVRRESRSPSRLRRLERRHSTKRRREEDTSSREAVILHGSDRKASSSRHKDRSSRSRRHSVDRQSSRKRRRQRSYSTSSGSSSCSGSASDESYTSGSSGSSSYSSSVSRSSSPVRHRRHHRSRHVYPAPPPITYSAMPVPVQMPMPVIMPTPPEEDMSRQQMSHLYRNMPSNPSELTVRASTSYAASPPRPAQNNFNFPGYAERAPTLPPNQALQMSGSAAGNVHPARAQAMSAGFGQSPYEPNQAETGYSNGSGYGNNRRGNSAYTSRPPPRPNGTGWPEPAAREPRKTSDWPDDRPNRPRQDRSAGGGQGNSRPSRHLELNASASAWGDSSGASDAWGASNGSGNAWGANSPKYQGSDTKTAAALDSNPWGSPLASSTADKGKSAPVWGDSAPAAVAAEEDSPWA